MRDWQQARLAMATGWRSSHVVGSTLGTNFRKDEVKVEDARLPKEPEISAGVFSGSESWRPSKTQQDLQKMVAKSAGDEAATTFPVKAIRAFAANGANVPEGTLGTLKDEYDFMSRKALSVISWDNGVYTADAKRYVDYQVVKREAAEKEPWQKLERLGQEVAAEDLAKSFADISGMNAGDLVAIMRSDGKWTYAQAIDKIGVSRSGTGEGIMLTFKTAPGERKEFKHSEWDKIKQLRPPTSERGWGRLVLNPLVEKIGDECSTEDLAKASTDMAGIVKGDVVVDLRSDGRWTYALVKDVIGYSRSTGSGTGLLLRVDQDGSEKKVISSEFGEKVKSIKVAATVLF
jgi:hypothetical protein